MPLLADWVNMPALLYVDNYLQMIYFLTAQMASK